MKSARAFLSSALLVGYVWSVCMLFDSLAWRSGRGMCSGKLSYLFLDNFMFVVVSVLSTILFASVVFILLIPIIRKLADERIIAIALAVSFFPVAFFLLVFQNKFSKLSDYIPAFFWSVLSAFGVGIIAYLLNRGLIKRLCNLLVVPAIAATVAAMPFLMRAVHELYLIEKTGVSFVLLASFVIYILPFVILFFIFLVWFQLKPKVAAPLGLIFLTISVFFTVLQPVFYTGPDIKCKGAFGNDKQDARVIDKPNFLFIVVDSLRADALEPYGSKIATPNISKFANGSLIFENAYSVSSWTLPAMSSFFSGLYPSAHGVIYPQDDLHENFDTVPQILGQNSYFTWAVVDQPLYNRYQGITKDFKAFHLIQCHPCYVIFSHPLIKTLEKLGMRTFPLCFRQTTKVVLDSATAIEKACRPFFGWVHILDPHMPLTPPAEFIDSASESKGQFRLASKREMKIAEILDKTDVGRGWSVLDRKLINRVRALYFAEVRYVDHEIAQIFRALEKSGLWNETVVLLTSDHGEELFEHGDVNHGHSLYNELLHVPLIVRIPNVSMKRIQTRIRTIDIAPTILELAKVEYSPDSFQGKSLVPLINGAFESDREVLAEVYYNEQKAIFMGQYKLLWRAGVEQYLLFNLTDDPKELYPISTSNEVKEQMLKRLDELLTSSANIYERITGKPLKHIYKPPSSDTIEQLKALGYIE